MTELFRPPRRAHIPEDLVFAVRERRVIPFVGAGFSSLVGLPNWDDLLRRLAADIDPGINYESIKAFANEDNLQIAEYLYIKSDRRIGPLRHIIEQGLAAHSEVVRSSAHVELANLGTPLIYTTNYDDLIESTYRSLDLPYSVVALPKDVANLHTNLTQVVKYHGDLRHETTLVLTESAYYKRLDFESPMDLKFRSDLLGRSVLYMGYSFRDINIRLIWFKLMQMMQDIPPADRRTSYIVRLTPNPVLDELYRDVGLQTVVLDPRGDYSPEDRALLLGEFLSELASRASIGGAVPGSAGQLFATSRDMEDIANIKRPARTHRTVFEYSNTRRDAVIRRFITRRIPRGLEPDAGRAFINALGLLNDFPLKHAPNFLEKVLSYGPDVEITSYFTRLMRGGRESLHRLRPRIVESTMGMNGIWGVIWGARLTHELVRYVVEEAEEEVNFTEDGHADEDLAYCADLLKRLVLGQLCDPSEEAELVARASELLTRAAAIYPSISDYEPDPAGPPRLEAILVQVHERMREVPEEPDDGELADPFDVFTDDGLV